MLCSTRATRNEKGTTYCVSCGAELQKIQTPSVEVPPLDTGAGRALRGPGRPGRLCTQHAQLPRAGRSVDVGLFRPLPVHAVLPFLGSITGIAAIVYGAQANGKSRGEQLHRARESSHMRRTWRGCVDLDHVRLRGLGVTHPCRFLLIFLLALAAGSGSA